MSSKTDVAVKLSLVFFITLLSFSIGTFVGKKYSDNQHQLATLEPQKNTHAAGRDVASVPGHDAAPTKEGVMTDDEIAKLAEEFVADDTAPVAESHDGHGNEHAKEHGAAAHGSDHAAPTSGHNEHEAAAPAPTHAAKPAEPAHAAPVAKVAAPAHHEEPSSAAKNIAAGKKPSVTNEKAAGKNTESRVPSSLPKNVANFTVGKFTVQVASYADEAEAQKYASDLKSKGYSAFYVPANISGKTWYRVSVGQFATQKEAQSYRTELASKAQVTSAIVQKITE